MTGQLNRQRVLKLLDMYYAGDLDGVLAQCSDDIDHFVSAPIDILPHLGARRGKAEVRQMWETVHSRYTDMRHEVRALVAEGDQVAADLRVFFRKRSNGRMLQFDMAIVLTWHDGRVARIREIIDTFDMLQQVIERDLSTLMLQELSKG
jgi:ketosteroid isomerase-like protein